MHNYYLKIVTVPETNSYIKLKFWSFGSQSSSQRKKWSEKVQCYFFQDVLGFRACLERMNEKHRNLVKCRNRKGMGVQNRGMEKQRKSRGGGVWNAGI